MDGKHGGWELDRGDDMVESGSFHRRVGNTEATGRGERTQTG